MKFAALFVALVALPILAVGFVNLSLIPQILTVVLDVLNTLSKVLTTSEISSLLTCLKTSETAKTSPYYTTDVWLRNFGYTVTNVTVTTNDSYILKVFRVTGSPKYTKTGTKPAIYVNHGLGGSSNMFLTQEGPNNVITQLADNGYDVWIGNCRGNSYSNKHVTMNVNNLTYWDFSWHEMGIYDVPAVIDTIIATTGQTKIFYLGYSMGTTQIMVALSEKPEYNAKIKLAILWAPAAILSASTTPARAASILGLNVNGTYLTDPIVGGRINTQNALQDKLGAANTGSICAASSVANCGVCAYAIFFIFGYSPMEMNYTATPSFVTNGLDVLGTKCLVHYTQQMNDAQSRFRKFDYGAADNQAKYGSAEPPVYSLDKITAPVEVYYGRGDILCPKSNVETLFTKFAANVINKTTLVDATNTNSQFGHMDFLVGKNVGKFVVEPVISKLNQYPRPT